jgi:hypothetical protein
MGNKKNIKRADMEHPLKFEDLQYSMVMFDSFDNSIVRVVNIFQHCSIFMGDRAVEYADKKMETWLTRWEDNRFYPLKKNRQIK